MIKNPLYQIFKISSTRLNRNGYSLSLTFEQAIINWEVVSLSSNQLLRTMRKLKGYTEDQSFIREYIAVKIDKKCHYKHLKRNGFVVNGRKYVRFLCGASNARNDTVFFIDKSIYDSMFEKMCCGIDIKNQSMVLAKWNAYFALNASSSYAVSEPVVAVIPDYHMDVNHTFEFVNRYESIERKDMTVEDYTVWDGMGVMSCEYASKIADELQMGYVPSTVVIRSTFVKGALFTMDIKGFADEIADKSVVNDCYENPVDLKNVDVIMTVSQFKMWKFYKSWQEYVDYQHKYDLGWGVTLVSHGVDDAHTFTNYQFLQVLDLSEEQIQGVCRKTLNWLNSVIGGDVMASILYLFGTEEFELDKVQDFALLSLIYNNSMIKDSYIRNRIIRSLNKKIRQSYYGKLLVNGNFSFIGCDPYAFLEYAFGMEPKGILGNGEYYSGFWHDRGVNRVCTMRSPLTWVSENNVVDLAYNDRIAKWYQYLQHGCFIINRWGVDTFLWADGDFDGDKIFSTDQIEMIEGKNSEYVYPVTYQKEAAPSSKWTEKRLYDTDLLSFGSKIGFVTNCSTYWYSLRSDYQIGTPQYEELTRRLIWSRYAQGENIDKTKGIKCEKYPVQWIRNSAESSDIDRELVVCAKPYFQKYIYPKLNREYQEWYETIRKFRMVGEDTSSFQCPVLDNNSVMNKICHYMESNIKEIREVYNINDQIELDKYMMNNDRELKLEYETYMKKCLKRYLELKKNLKNELQYSNREEKETCRKKFYYYCDCLKRDIIEEFGDYRDATNMAVYVGYNTNSQENREFVWDLFGRYVFENIKSNTHAESYVPVLDPEGDIEYLGLRYSRKKVEDAENRT